MLFYSLFFLSITIRIISGQQTIIYVKRGDIAELCDNRSTTIFAYEYRSFDGKKNLIVERSKDERLSNPYGTSLLRINNVNEDDSGLYKCPQDDIEWQKLQVYGKLKRRRRRRINSITSSIDKISFFYIEEKKLPC